MAERKDIHEIEKVRRVFTTEEGRDYLAEHVILDMLQSIEPGNVEQVVAHNKAVALLFDLGVIVDTNARKLVDSFLSMPYNEGDESNGN